MKATLKPWAQKQLSQFGHQINESDLVAAFTSATHECNFIITNVSFMPEDAVLSVTAFGKMNDEEEEYFIRVVYPTPKLPRVKDLSELIGSKIFKICNYAQYSAKARHRAILGCYAAIALESGETFNLSTSDKANMSKLLDSRKDLRLKYQNGQARQFKYLEVK